MSLADLNRTYVALGETAIDCKAEPKSTTTINDTQANVQVCRHVTSSFRQNRSSVGTCARDADHPGSGGSWNSHHETPQSGGFLFGSVSGAAGHVADRDRVVGDLVRDPVPANPQPPHVRRPVGKRPGRAGSSASPSIASRTARMPGGSSRNAAAWSIAVRHSRPASSRGQAQAAPGLGRGHQRRLPRGIPGLPLQHRRDVLGVLELGRGSGLFHRAGRRQSEAA